VKVSRRRHYQRGRGLGQRGMRGRVRRVKNGSLLPGRFPPIAVKLNGETARTKPSRARYSVRLWVGQSAWSNGKKKERRTSMNQNYFLRVVEHIAPPQI
jgi:hypothetical protein